jgi:L-fuconolactonase
MTLFGFDFPERDVPPSSEELVRPVHRAVHRSLRARACMFESNFPPDKQSGGYTELWNAFKRIISEATAAEKAALYSGTAARVYRITRPEAAAS